LFHRLNILSIHVPPIRERAGDIAPLVAHFLSKHAELARSGPLTAADDFIAALARGELPGNVRQLENLVRLAIVQKEDGEALSLVDLPSELWASLATAGSDDELATGGPEDPAAMSASTSGSSDADDLAPHSYASHVLELNGWNLSRSLASCERSLVAAALEATEGNQSETARLLGITPRSVYNKLRKHQLLNDRSASRTNVPEPPFRASRLR
jgi:DNA-binding NtrC family response regulator